MNNTFEENDWDPLVELLRFEVQEYGGLYNLLDRQQREIFQRDPELVMNTNSEIESYMAEMGKLRARREEKVREMARACGADEELSLSKMLPFFPEFVRPMLQALVDEVNHMVRRTRHRARQNFMLLSRTMEITHEALRSLQPERFSSTYTKKGRVGLGGKMPSRYRAFV